MRISTTAPMLLAASGSASVIDKRQMWTDWFRSADEFCQNPDWSTPESAKDSWYGLGLGIALNEFIIETRDKDSTSWVEELEKHHGAVSGVSGATSCRQFGQGCNPGNRWSSCDNYFEQFKDDPWGWGMSSYYLFEAVKGLHRKLDKFNSRVVEGTMLSNLKVDEMIDNLGGSDEGHSDVFNWITAAIGWGDFIAEQGSIGSPVYEAASGHFSQILGIMSTIGDSALDDVDAGDIRSSLGDAFDAATKGLRATLELALGYGDLSDIAEKLPSYVEDTDSSAIGRFFGDGFWLLSESSETFDNILNQFERSIQAKVADHILQASGHMLLGGTTTSEEECGDRTGGRWLKVDDHDEWYCFWLVETSGQYPVMKEEKYEYLEEYGIDNLDEYYKAIISCANGEEQENRVVTDEIRYGEVPHCLFNMRVGTTYWETQPGCFETGMPDNGSGDDDSTGWPDYSDDHIPRVRRQECPQVMMVEDL